MLRRRPSADRPGPAGRPVAAGYLHAVTDEAAWADLAHAAGAALPGSSVVKVVVDRRGRAAGTPDSCYFLDTVRYPSHVDFCRVLDPRVDAGFDTVMYRSPDRPFVLATLTRLPSRDPRRNLAWLELWPGDTLAAEEVARLLESVRAGWSLAEPIAFKAASDEQRRRIEAAPRVVRARIGALLDQGAVLHDLPYQGLTLGVAHGRLRVLRDVDDAELADLTPYDVVVAATIPLAIGPVAGLVTGEHQTPLAHVAVLSAGRGTPNCAVPGAHDQQEFTDLDGSWVRLEVARASYRLEPVAEEVARAAVEERLVALRAAAPVLEVSDARGSKPPLSSRRSRRLAVVGAKSAGLAELRRRRRLRLLVVPGFTVPLGEQRHHLRRDPAVVRALADLDDAAGGGGGVTERLAAVRAAVLGTEVEQGLVRDVRQRLDVLLAGSHPLVAGAEGAIFRSSSNCEDLPGFSGAGLADSFPARGTLDDDVVADRLRQVWASLWSDRGYAERTASGLDQSRAAMGVLVQPLVPHAVHVVALTTNPVKPGAIPAYYLNLLPAGSLVTDEAGAGAEQLLVFDDDPACAEVLCLAAGRDSSLLPDGLLEDVRGVLHEVDRHARRRWGGPADVELLLLPEGRRPRLALLQARPFGTS